MGTHYSLKVSIRVGVNMYIFVGFLKRSVINPIIAVLGYEHVK